MGLGYLTLDRPTRSLSGGETERVNLTTCLGTGLVNTLFVLDEPSVGLHSRDTERLVHVLEQLRNAGNTVVVVEHEASVIRAANQIVDLGPGHGASGGEVVFQGTYAQILGAEGSLTGQYLSGRKQVEVPQRRQVNAGQVSRLSRAFYAGRKDSSRMELNDALLVQGDRRDSCSALKLAHATRNNLKDLTVEIPLGRLVCITGVSGSGKTTLVREVLLPALIERLKSELPGTKASDRLCAEQNGEDEETEAAGTSQDCARLEGAEQLGRVVLVDQSILGKTPRSNPAVYIGAFDDIREFFAQSEAARQRGLNASAFSFNSAQGQCERCRGAGYEKIEMQFLSDVFIRCPDCNGRRYRAHILEVKVGKETGDRRQETGEGRKEKAARSHRPSVHGTQRPAHAMRSRSIGDLLDSTVEEAIEFLAGFDESRPARRAVESLRLLQEVGLGYLKLGQPINTLSGGESQRLKLVRHLAEAVVGEDSERKPFDRQQKRTPHPGALPFRRGEGGSGRTDGSQSLLTSAPTMFLFDEPTTGLHFEDVRVLLKVFQRLVEAGHSVVVIEHNLDVIKSADWIIDLGPEAGDEGGEIVAVGTPEEVAACEASHTGRALQEVLGSVALRE
ncbi:MAG: hypothetical protein DME25_08145 [Verrucomicrobia bacterium]|nr:MAG: hypothetical protein DME25_08145 [Verrucomicrobiota bacterium]